MLRSHTSSKCVLGLTHYPCWKCPESRRENVWNPDCPDLKKIPGFPDQTWRPVEPYAPKSYIFQMCSRAHSLPLLKIFSVTSDVELEVTELIWVNCYPLFHEDTIFDWYIDDFWPIYFITAIWLMRLLGYFITHMQIISGKFWKIALMKLGVKIYFLTILLIQSQQMRSHYWNWISLLCTS